MHSININLNGDPERRKKLLDPNGPLAGRVIRLPAIGSDTLEFRIIPEYTQSGRPGVEIQVNLPNGFIVIAETTLSAFQQAAEAFKARWGDVNATKHEAGTLGTPDMWVRRKPDGKLWVQMGTTLIGDDTTICLVEFESLHIPGGWRTIAVSQAKLREKFRVLNKKEAELELSRRQLRNAFNQET